MQPLRRLLLAFLLLDPVSAIAAEPGSANWPLVPGRMGFNALPSLPNVDPVPGRTGRYELAAATQLSGLRGDDVAATPYFRLTLPFREIAALEVDGTPVELWRTTTATQARLDARARQGSARGDLRFGAQFLVLEESARAPAFGVRFLVKSTTGKALASRRFTNAPGYLVDFLAGKDAGSAGNVRLRVLARLGLLVWQFAPDRQDDALAYGATVRAALPRGSALSLEWRGYVGWRYADRPSVLGLTASLPVGGTELSGTINRGLSSDATPLEFRVGFARRFEMPGIARARPSEPPPPARTPTPARRVILASTCPPPGAVPGAEPSPACEPEEARPR